jgi:hypothetical protein
MIPPSGRIYATEAMAAGPAMAGPVDLRVEHVGNIELA